jgi:hypothetical protein
MWKLSLLTLLSQLFWCYRSKSYLEPSTYVVCVYLHIYVYVCECVCVWVHAIKLNMCLSMFTLIPKPKFKIVEFEFPWWWLWGITLLWNVTQYNLMKVMDVSKKHACSVFKISACYLLHGLHLDPKEKGHKFLWSIPKFLLEQCSSHIPETSALQTYNCFVIFYTCSFTALGIKYNCSQLLGITWPIKHDEVFVCFLDYHIRFLHSLHMKCVPVFYIWKTNYKTQKK